MDERLPRLAISLARGDTPVPACTDVADYLYDYFMTPISPGRPFGRYQQACSIIEIPGSFDGYLSGPAGYATRRKVRRAEREGYEFREIDPEAWVEDILAVNRSLPERQGRPIDDAYLVTPTPGRPLANGCPRHREVWFAVIKDDHVVAYTWVYVAGEMCLLNRILGHGDHMEAGVMYRLIAGTIEQLAPAGIRYVMYERHTSGSPGLRTFKERMGFAPFWVDWRHADESTPSNQTAFERYQQRQMTPSGPFRRLARRVRQRILGLPS